MIDLPVRKLTCHLSAPLKEPRSAEPSAHPKVGASCRLCHPAACVDLDEELKHLLLPPLLLLIPLFHLLPLNCLASFSFSSSLFSHSFSSFSSSLFTLLIPPQSASPRSSLSPIPPILSPLSLLPPNFSTFSLCLHLFMFSFLIPPLFTYLPLSYVPPLLTSPPPPFPLRRWQNQLDL